MKKKVVIKMEEIESKIRSFFPNKELKRHSLVPFSHVDFSIGEENFSEDFCIIFQLEGSKLKYVYNTISTVLYTNLQNLESNIMKVGTTQIYGEKNYKLIYTKGQYGLEVKDEPKIKNYQDAWEVWKKNQSPYLREFRGSFYAPFVKSMVRGEEGYIVALKNAGDERRDIVFIRADNGTIHCHRSLSKIFQFFYLDNNGIKETVDLPIPPAKKCKW